MKTNDDRKLVAEEKDQAQTLPKAFMTEEETAEFWTDALGRTEPIFREIDNLLIESLAKAHTLPVS